MTIADIVPVTGEAINTINVEIFSSAEFGEIRTVAVNGEPFVMLKDVCTVLGIGNPSQAKTRLKKDGVIINEVIDSLGRTQKADFINESNLYKLIFQSRKPQAERFSEWVTSDVLPTIRKHGMYATEELLDNPDLLIQVATQLKEEKQRNKLLQEQNEAMKPKAIFAEAVASSSQSILIRELAKLIKQNGVDIGEKRLFAHLREGGYLIKQGADKNLPTQKSMNLGLMEIKETVINNPDGTVRLSRTTKITGKGQTYFINKFLNS
jgi:anti-repressor protein